MINHENFKDVKWEEGENYRFSYHNYSHKLPNHVYAEAGFVGFCIFAMVLGSMIMLLGFLK